MSQINEFVLLTIMQEARVGLVTHLSELEAAIKVFEALQAGVMDKYPDTKNDIYLRRTQMLQELARSNCDKVADIVERVDIITNPDVYDPSDVEMLAINIIVPTDDELNKY